jgi:hypothetical protein
MQFFACDAGTVGVQGRPFGTEKLCNLWSATGCLQVCSKIGRRHGKHVLSNLVATLEYEDLKLRERVTQLSPVKACIEVSKSARQANQGQQCKKVQDACVAPTSLEGQSQ